MAPLGVVIIARFPAQKSQKPTSRETSDAQRRGVLDARICQKLPAVE
jgi:hypothetical protein